MGTLLVDDWDLDEGGEVAVEDDGDESRVESVPGELEPRTMALLRSRGRKSKEDLASTPVATREKVRGVGDRVERKGL